MVIGVLWQDHSRFIHELSEPVPGSLLVRTIEKAGGRRAGSSREKGEVPPSPFLSRILLAADPACCPLAFSIILTDREPGTG